MAQSFQATGLTCGHCVASVTAELTALVPGAEVSIELGEPSVITVTGSEVTAEQVAEALDEAGGYVLVTAG